MLDTGVAAESGSFYSFFGEIFLLLKIYKAGNKTVNKYWLNINYVIGTHFLIVVWEGIKDEEEEEGGNFKARQSYSWRLTAYMH